MAGTCQTAAADTVATHTSALTFFEQSFAVSLAQEQVSCALS